MATTNRNHAAPTMIVGAALLFVCLAFHKFSQAQDKSTGTSAVLPRPDFHFPGYMGRTYLESDPVQFQNQ